MPINGGPGWGGGFMSNLGSQMGGGGMGGGGMGGGGGGGMGGPPGQQLYKYFNTGKPMTNAPGGSMNFGMDANSASGDGSNWFNSAQYLADQKAKYAAQGGGSQSPGAGWQNNTGPLPGGLAPYGTGTNHQGIFANTADQGRRDAAQSVWGSNPGFMPAKNMY